MSGMNELTFHGMWKKKYGSRFKGAPYHPKTFLVRSLYDWGVNILRAESADF